ncbi:hypothetical protein SCALM49S_09511 [Streptomyces californicus]
MPRTPPVKVMSLPSQRVIRCCWRYLAGRFFCQMLAVKAFQSVSPVQPSKSSEGALAEDRVVVPDVLRGLARVVRTAGTPTVPYLPHHRLRPPTTSGVLS